MISIVVTHTQFSRKTRKSQEQIVFVDIKPLYHSNIDSSLYCHNFTVSTFPGGLHLCSSCDFNSCCYKPNFPGKPGSARNKFLSQTIMESFNQGEHVIAAFLDVKKAFDNVWHNGLRYKIYQLDLLPTILCRWLSDFLVGRVIQVKIEGFLSPKVYTKAGVSQGSNLSPLLFLIYVNDMPNPTHHQTNKSQFADDAGQWAVSKNIDLAAEYLQRDLDKLARWCAKFRIKLNPEKTKVIIFSKSRSAIRAEPALSL